KELNAYVLVLADEAMQKARDAEKALSGKQEHPPLLGLPIAIKDLFDMKAGVPNTFGCKPFKDYVPDVSATYVERLERAGAIVLAVPFAHAGPLARSVADAVLMLNAIVGPEDRDPYSLPADAADYMAATRRGIKGLRVAWSPNLGGFPIEREVARVTAEAVRAFEDAGATVGEVNVKFPRGQAELCDAWLRQSAVRAAESAEGLKQ